MRRPRASRAVGGRCPPQPLIMDDAADALCSAEPGRDALQDLDVESLSPLEALTKLFELKRLADGEPAQDA